MGYDPFARGPHPVGVRTVDLRDPARDRTLPTEVWYPATEDARGADLAAETRDSYQMFPGAPAGWQHAVRDAPAAAQGGAWPLVVFSHGFGGHRRQSTFLCTHLASHGYLVAAPDHTGNTVAELFGRQPSTDQRADTVTHRPRDVSFVLDAIAEVAGSPVDATRVAMTGHSFGGFTALAATVREPRIAVTVALAPAGGESPSRTEMLQPALALDTPRAQPHLVIAADRDSILPLPGVRALYDKLCAPKRLVVLRDTDHFHFCDAARQVHEMFRVLGVQIPTVGSLPPMAELTAPGPAQDVVRALGLAQIYAVLRNHAEARAFVIQDADALAALFESRGAAVDIA